MDWLNDILNIELTFWEFMLFLVAGLGGGTGSGCWLETVE